MRAATRDERAREETMMRHQLAYHRVCAEIAGGAALGAVAMYVLDPDKGRRRRALARGKARRVAADIGDFFGVAARDAANRVRGLQARARRLIGRATSPDDLMIIERVRARMGRIVSHPHAIQIGARGGRVTLSGPILTSEVRRLLDAVRSVRGVSDIDNCLVAHDHPGSISSLQGGVERQSPRPEILQENWTPSLRIAAVVGGGLLALCGLRVGNSTGAALAGIGLSLTARGATNMPIRRMAERVRDQAGALRHLKNEPARLVDELAPKPF
jgi:hypothetical protein